MLYLPQFTEVDYQFAFTHARSYEGPLTLENRLQYYTQHNPFVRTLLEMGNILVTIKNGLVEGTYTTRTCTSIADVLVEKNSLPLVSKDLIFAKLERSGKDYEKLISTFLEELKKNHFLVRFIAERSKEIVSATYFEYCIEFCAHINSQLEADQMKVDFVL